jgi:alkanesulfonate monooxygenase SsuD/methylene tetrahydromethanopterin reductase-like flavin-dependent oxidoreductase (luciferase family)
MRFDVFFSICQTEVQGHTPSERQMFANFFDQVEAADRLGYGTAWIAESHLSCEVQKQGPRPVIPNFKGEIGLNTDVLLLASRIFAKTKRIQVGSAIRSILVNGGPIAHAEAVRTFLSLHSLDPAESRRLQLGFAAGRFPFSTQPFGIIPRSAWEEACWPQVKSKIFLEATEIFLRFLRGDTLSSLDVTPQMLCARDFGERTDEWQRIRSLATDSSHGPTPTWLKPGQEWRGVTATEEALIVPPRWIFDRLAIVPRQTPLDLLDLFIGSHDPVAQIAANQWMPCGVFNLSITPGSEIERTHARMRDHYFCTHQKGATPETANTTRPWQRDLMPRTVLIFLEADPRLSPEAQSQRAQEQARGALDTYWQALEGTLDERRVQQAADNALVGNPRQVAAQIRERFHPEDRLMLWFDFFNHDSAAVIRALESFQAEVVPLL